MDVRVLGPLEVLVDDASVPLGGVKQRTVFALLAASSGQTVAASALILGVYGDDAPPSALRTIHTYVSNLRHEVGDLIVRSGDGYRMVLDESTVLDSAEFETLSQRGSALLEGDPQSAGRVLREALSIWRGHAYADVEAHAGIEAEITRLTEMRISALEARVDADLARGAHREIVGELEALCEEHPLRESFRAQHMLALYRSGRQAEALRAYSRTRAVLGEELGIEPGHRLQELEEMVLTQSSRLDLQPTVTVERLAVLTAEIGEFWSEEPMHVRDEVSAKRDTILSRGAGAAGGAMFDVRGNAAMAAFPAVGDTLTASRELSALNLQVALDHGEVEVSDERISGPPVNRSLRLAAIANPGQILISSEAQAVLATSGSKGWAVISLGAHEVSGLGNTQLFQLAGDGLATGFGPLRVDRLPQPMPADRHAGTLPGYELRDEIGSNDFSVVYRAYQASVGREVAVRVFDPDLVSDPRFIRRFEAVAQRIAAIEHPHILPMLDYWRDPGRAVLVHRLVTGGTLTGRLDDLDRSDLVAILQKVGSALAVAHDYGVVHGDVNTDNVLLDVLGNPYLADLGVATIVEGLASESRPPLLPPTDVHALRSLVEESGRGGPPSHGDPETIEHFFAGLEGVAPIERLTPVRNPYKGLAAYGVGDTDDFYGRDDVVAQLIETVAARSLIMVVGPSGVGKSSIVMAGLIPEMRRGAVPGSAEWLVAEMYPGEHPFDRLETTMGRVAVRSPGRHVERMREGGLALADAARQFLPEDTTLLLVIDQFEELFTQVIEESERRRFLDLMSELASEPDAPVKIVATVRADFFDRPLKYANFGAAIAESLAMVAAPTRDELAEIVRCPAEGVGVTVEEPLVAALVEEADEEIGGLPLLQLALTELFETRTSDVLTLDQYRTAGGLVATVGNRAESVFRTLDDDEQGVAREVFLSLVSVGEEAADTRRRTRVADLEEGLEGQDSVERVLAEFGKARLLVFDRDPITRGPTVEVAHEALIARWDRYGEWIDEVRDDLLVRRRVEVATREWLESGENPDYLLGGSRLEGAEIWRDGSGVRVGTDEARFLTQSRETADVAQARVARIRRRVLTGLSAALVVVALLGIVAWVQRGVANRSTIEARVQELTAQAHLAVAEDPNLAINLAVEAYDKAQALEEMPGEVMTALQATIQSSRQVAILPDAGTLPGWYPAAWSPDGSMLALASSTKESEVVVHDTDGFTEIARFDVGGIVYQVSFSPDGESIAVGLFQGPENVAEMESQTTIPLVARFEPRSGRKIDEFVGPCCSEWFGFSPDGRLLAAGGWWGDDPDFTTVWDITSPGEPRYVHEEAWFEAWSPDSSSFLASRFDPATVRFVDSTTGTTLREQGFSSSPSTLDVNPVTGDLVVVLADEATTQVLSATDELIAEYFEQGIVGARFSHDGRRMFRWGNRDDVLVTDLKTGEAQELHGHAGGASTATESPDGRFLAVTTESRQTVIWDLSEVGPDELGNILVGGIVTSAVSNDDGTDWHAVDGEARRGVRISVGGVSEDQVSGEFQFGYQMNPVMSPAGLIGGRGTDGVGRVESLPTGDVLFTLPEGECGFPIAIDDPGETAVIGGGGGPCGIDAEGGVVIDLSTDKRLFEIGHLPTDAGFGHPGTISEDLVITNRGFTDIEVRRLPEGDLVGQMRVPRGAFRPFVSADGRWVTWGSAVDGAFLVDLEAVLAGTSMEDAVALNPRVESGPTTFTRASGEFLASAFSRGIIRVWKIDTGELWFTLPESDHPSFTYIMFSSDGRYLYYADGGQLRRMPLDPEELASVARERTLRDFTVEECERFLDDTVDCTIYGQ